ncbi:MAG: riboflavin synthase [Pirellulaceae bacterium]
MFTGLVEEMGEVHALEVEGSGVRIVLRTSLVAQDAAVGDSISVNGCCLTVVKIDQNLLSFEAGSETLSRTNLGRLAKGSRVNLERSLQLGDRLGGHYVTGHIDGMGTVIKRRDDGDWSTLTFRAAAKLTRQMAPKGSVTVDGVSLTIVTADEDRFHVALIPHTLQQTTLGSLVVGDVANLETDLLAKYVQRQLESRKPDTSIL